jgi:hypothetical protein
VFSYIARPSAKTAFLWRETVPDLYSLAVPIVNEKGEFTIPDALALEFDLMHVGVDNILVNSDNAQITGYILDVLCELLDDLPGWERQATSGSILWWRQI